ncbi:MAG: MOSC N-terminal beta barrel domain-containing protein [Terrimesophilobacter sp.]
MTSQLRVTRLRTYPVKSLAGNDVDSAHVEPWGFAGDRRWGLIDDTGKNVTARMVHRLLGLHAEHHGDGGIRISDRGGQSITVPTPVGGSTVPVGFSGLDSATLASEDADAWLTERMGRSLRLVWQSDPTARPIPEKHGGQPGESLSLADDGPLLLVTESSLAQLNDWVAADSEAPDVPDLDPSDVSDDPALAPNAGNTAAFTPLDIVRFRPNVVVDGHAPFAEDRWGRVWLGGVEFRRTVLCDRCVMTTIEPTTLAGGKEPIRTLARHRRWDGKTWFGIRLAPVGLPPVGLDPNNRPTINIGDNVRVEIG